VTDRPHPIETNVIKLSVPHQSSTESSIPSSYEKLSINIPGPDSYRPGSYPIISGAQARPTSYGLEHGLFRLPAAPTSEVTHHNRGRRGGLVSDDPLTVAVMKTPPGKYLVACPQKISRWNYVFLLLRFALCFKTGFMLIKIGQLKVACQEPFGR
jgi:hypothetical protein